ncbi:MAG: hypothetical protein M5T52_24595 [Ignavibacteriaceae bacterium]|nr:hypothetical protein [Ignavibacteriaceae bacterium]
METGLCITIMVKLLVHLAGKSVSLHRIPLLVWHLNMIIFLNFLELGKAYGLGFRGISGNWQYCDPTLAYFGQEFRERIAFEILGRMCHLLQDMSVPAHANLDPHGDDPALIDDYYESYFGYDYYWNAQNVYTQIGGMINPYLYQPSNPLHFLMYTTNQMANHFATQGPHKNLIMITLAAMAFLQK